jgi:hypothetical protein
MPIGNFPLNEIMGAQKQQHGQVTLCSFMMQVEDGVTEMQYGT